MPAVPQNQEILNPGHNTQFDSRILRFTENGTFQISVFEDLHFAEDVGRDIMTDVVMTNVLSEEEAQLVVLNGDLISGEVVDESNSGKYLHQIVAPLVSMGKVWASTYGNHDSEVSLDPMTDIYEQEIRYPNSLTQSMISGPKAGITNYYLPVYPHDASESTPTLILWFFDSKGGHYATKTTKRATESSSVARGDWVDQDVVEWFIEAKANLTTAYGEVIPSLAFYHIPAHSMLQYQEESFDSHATPGINGEKVVSQGSMDTEYTGQDRQFMHALLHTPGLIATFSGHDHENDWCFKWDGRIIDQNLTGNGINMCYGRHTGYGGYSDVTRGGRQIFLDLATMNDEVKTWIRLEDGRISAPVTLNATYGQDKYGPDRYRIGPQSEIRTSGGSSACGPLALPLIYLWLAILSFWYWRC